MRSLRARALDTAHRVIVPLFIFIGGLVSAATPGLLFDPDDVGVFVGVVIELIALIIAIAAGIIAMRRGLGEHEKSLSATSDER